MKAEIESHKTTVEGDTASPSIPSKPSIESTPKDSIKMKYKANEEIKVTVTFNKNANIDQSKLGTGSTIREKATNRPYLLMLENGNPRNMDRMMFYTEGTGTATWKFTYKVRKGRCR